MHGALSTVLGCTVWGEVEQTREPVRGRELSLVVGSRAIEDVLVDASGAVKAGGRDVVLFISFEFALRLLGFLGLER